MIQQQQQPEDQQNKEQQREEGGNVAKYPEERRDEQVMKTQINKKRTSSNDSSPSSSFENKISKHFDQHKQSEFKVHFYVRHVHMNGMSDNEFLSFIKRKVNLAGSCDVVQMFNQQGPYCDVAIGMSNDDNAKLVYIGKKHFNFGRNGRQKENIELSDAFRNYLENKKMLDKEHLERSLRRNQLSKGRSESSESSRRYKSRSTSKKKKAKKIENKQTWQGRRRSPSSSSEPRRLKKTKKNRHSSQSSSRESNKESLNVQPIKPQQVFTDKNSVFIFSIPLEVNEDDVIAEITNIHKQSAPISHTWNTVEQMQYLELLFQDENTAQFLVNLRPCLHVKGIPLLVVGKKQRPVQELLRNFEVQIEFDKDILAFNVYSEFKKYGDIIGIYVFQQNRNYLLLYSSSSQLQEALRPPVHLQLTIQDQTINATAKIIEKPIDIQRPQIKETLAYQLNYQNENDDKKKDKKIKKVDKPSKK